MSLLYRLISACFTLLSVADFDSNQAISQTLLSVFKVLLNLTHENALGCDRVGGEVGVMEALLQCVLMVRGCVVWVVSCDDVCARGEGG